jgi:hypothetical protein
VQAEEARRCWLGISAIRGQALARRRSKHMCTFQENRHHLRLNPKVETIQSAQRAPSHTALLCSSTCMSPRTLREGLIHPASHPYSPPAAKG